MAKRMILKKDVLKLVIDQLGRRVMITLNFITDHLYFLVDLVLRILTVEDNVGKHIDSLDEMLFGDCCVKDSVLLVRKGIQLSAHTLQGIDNLQRISTFGPLEGHVFAEVGETILREYLVTSACLYLITTVNHLRETLVRRIRRNSRWQVNNP